jgi:hypothetical protein
MTSRGGRSGEFAVCVHNGDVDLIVAKIYPVMKPKRDDRPSDIRTLDELGEDYLYPRGRFVPVELPLKAKKALVAIH